jgi:hypothetical protein
MQIWFDHVDYLLETTITPIDNSLGFHIPHLGTAYQHEDSVQRRFGDIASQKERQVSLRSHTLDGGRD